MKHKVFVIFGNDKVRILKNNQIAEFCKIKDEINIYEFQTLEEAEAFKKGIDEAIGWNGYEILSDEEISYIMEKSSNEYV